MHATLYSLASGTPQTTIDYLGYIRKELRVRDTSRTLLDILPIVMNFLFGYYEYMIAWLISGNLLLEEE